jgi:hypothetical protein
MAATITIENIIEEASATERFGKLDADRSSVLERARNCAKLTIPSVVPDSGHTESQDLETPYQAVGSRLVHNLASKLLLSLLPPNTSFFRLVPSPEVIEVTKQQGTNNDMEKQLVAVEQELMKQIEREALRVPIFEAVKSLVISGNSLLYKTEEGIKAYKLANYVVVRDFSGKPIEIITREVVTKDTLPLDILEKLQDDEAADGADISLYTRAVYREGQWFEYQEVDGVFVEGSDSTYKDLDNLPFIPLRWTSINGENYGRGLVEQYLGDFRSLEALYQLLIEASAVMSRVLFGKKPGTMTEIDDINEAENGACIYGDLEQDITSLRVDKNSDLQVPLQMVQDLIKRLEQAFLVASSATRDSERTTATEVRYMAADLEKALGGVYSILSLELQRPLATILLSQSKINLKQLGIEPVIVTGIEALGRNLELDKIVQFNRLLQEMGSPELVLQRMNIDAYIGKIGNALSLDTSDLIKSGEQIQQEQQQAQQEQLMQQGATNVVDNMTQQPQQ